MKAGPAPLSTASLRPLWLSGLVVVALPKLLALAGPALVRRRTSLGRLSTSKEVAGFEFATVSMTSAVLLTFAVVESTNLALDG